VAVADERELAEGWFERGCVELVVGCFSTALLTASEPLRVAGGAPWHGDDVGAVDPVPEQQPDSGHPVDALIPDLSSVVRSDDLPPRATDSLDALILTVGYAMQPHRLAARRSEAEAFLVEHYEYPCPLLQASTIKHSRFAWPPASAATAKTDNEASAAVADAPDPTSDQRLASRARPAAVGLRHQSRIDALSPPCLSPSHGAKGVPQGKTEGIQVCRPERKSGAIDHSPFVHLRRPIRTRGPLRFAASEGPRARALPSQAPVRRVPPGSPRGTTPFCEGHTWRNRTMRRGR
jgi:hypothetical protein